MYLDISIFKKTKFGNTIMAVDKLKNTCSKFKTVNTLTGFIPTVKNTNWEVNPTVQSNIHSTAEL